MGKISQGILGGLSGKVGNVIGGNWKGIDYLRIKPSEVANPRTEGQIQTNEISLLLHLNFCNLTLILLKLVTKVMHAKKVSLMQQCLITY